MAHVPVRICKSDRSNRQNLENALTKTLQRRKCGPLATSTKVQGSITQLTVFIGFKQKVPLPSVQARRVSLVSFAVEPSVVALL